MAKKHVILFAGTTEGRILANWLDEQSGVTGIVCVATEYGAELLEEEMSLKHLTVHCGRLDEGAMEAFLKKESPSLVIDATHPYAQVVTANIRKACEKYPDICLLRCLRKESEDEAKDSKGDKNGIIHVKNTAEAVRYLSEKEMQPVYLDCCDSFPVWTLSSLSDSRRGICHRQGRTSGTDLCFPVFLTYPYNRPFLTTGRWCKNVLYPVSGLWNPLRNPGADL